PFGLDFPPDTAGFEPQDGTQPLVGMHAATGHAVDRADVARRPLEVETRRAGRLLDDLLDDAGKVRGDQVVIGPDHDRVAGIINHRCQWFAVNAVDAPHLHFAVDHATPVPADHHRPVLRALEAPVDVDAAAARAARDPGRTQVVDRRPGDPGESPRQA